MLSYKFASILQPPGKKHMGWDNKRADNCIPNLLDPEVASF